MGSLIVQEPGLFTTIQDSGRSGYRKYGVPQSGVMDERAYELANKLVGNTAGTAVLEMTLKGGVYEFNTDAMVAFTGAVMEVRRNGIAMPMNSSISVKRGDKLTAGHVNRGCRTYLAIRGALRVKPVMGSRSTYVTGRMGGIDGRALQKGDVVDWEEDPLTFDGRTADKKDIPYYSSSVVLNTYQGPEWDWLDEQAKIFFSETIFRVAQSSNRMGIRTTGEPVDIACREMISSPVIPGIVQLPPDGNPIILHKDSQTIGGYPRIAKVADDELRKAGQLKPGDTLQFNISAFGY